ncbi:band 4.1-like protein 1 isoform X1, partial [Tachysurus ichikawai]
QQPVQELGDSDGNCEETVVSDNDVIQPQEGDPCRRFQTKAFN